MFKVHRKTANQGKIRYDDLDIRSELVGVIDLEDKNEILEILKKGLFREEAQWYGEFDGNIEPGDFVIDENFNAYIIQEDFKDIRKMHDSTLEIYNAP